MTSVLNIVLREKVASFNDTDQKRILNALELAGEDPSGAVCLLLDLGMDADTIVAALIRPLFSSGAEELTIDQFGPVVHSLVYGAQKIDGLKTVNKTIQEAQNIRNMLFALTDDIRVIFIKLAEKLHALRCFDIVPDFGTFEGETMVSLRKAAARECLDIYAPLANRLGISWLKNEMEDLSLKFLNREVYQQIKTIVAEKREQRNQFLEFAREIINLEAEAAGIHIEVESRAKHFYAVYMKMRKRSKSPSEIYDLSGIRIICDTAENCYMLLGIVHRNWKPVNGCFRDYIAYPKPNGYQSLHTTVMFEKTHDSEDEEGKLLEIQIRTRTMHRIAEHGVASHWLYKRGSSRDMVLPEDISIVNKLKDWKQGDADTGEISPAWLEDIKGDLLRNRVYVFTPQGKVIKLKAGATPIDFAYQIHTAVGEHCVGAKANGSIIPLSSQLKNTQVVEILTSQAAHPHFNWLQLAKSSKTRSKIRSWLARNSEFHSAEKVSEVKKIPSPIGGTVSPKPDRKSPVQMPVQPLKSVLRVRIGEEKNMMIRFARCCNPVPDDLILGYVSRGRGIIIHRENCSNLANNPEFDKRNIEAEWEIPVPSDKFPLSIKR